MVKLDINTPIWRPLAVFSTGDIVISRNQWPELGTSDIEHGVVTIRRQPYGACNRLDEFVELQDIPTTSLQGLDRLRRRWGMETLEPVFLRGIYRLGIASRLFNDAGIQHHQIFQLVNDSGFRSAQLNFNNISIDGSTGDTDSVRLFAPNTPIEWSQLRESLGGAVMYLMMVQRVQLDLVSDDAFIFKIFDTGKGLR